MNMLQEIAVDWQSDYRQKVCTAEYAASQVQNHDIISLAGGGNVPEAFVDALTRRAGELENVTLLLGFALKQYEFMDKKYRDAFNIETVFVGPMERSCIQQGRTSYVPIHLSRLGQWLDVKNPEMVVVSVTPPDEQGHMNRSCYAALTNRRAFDHARTVIVEVNENLPWLCGDDFKIHVSEVDYIIENNFAVPEIPDITITRTEETIAGYIADMIENGATIQLGLGGLANAVGYMLRDKKDLGVHAEVISNSIVDLVQRGVVNGSRKKFYPGKVLGCYCVGTGDLWKYIDKNNSFIWKEVEYINNPRIIARNEGIISINNTLMMDLTGMAASESIRTYQYSGTGGQVNFIQGATMARMGKSILAMTSSYVDKQGKIHSKIVPTLPEGTVVTTSRNDIEYVVTEYGVANLRWQSISNRAKMLINIAHPDFRDELEYKAKNLGWFQ